MYKVLNSESLEWNIYVEKLPLDKRDIYFTSEYLKLYENNGDGIARLFVYEEDSHICIYPFLINQIKCYDFPEDYYDIQTPYGYGGPVSSYDDSEFLLRFENKFLEYCKENNVVAEFIRFNPCIGNENLFIQNIDIIKNRITVALNLDKSIEDIWGIDIKSKNRNMIKKSEKSGLSVEIYNDYNTFKNIYETTMGKVAADEYYYFKPEYYTYMEKNDNYVMINVKFQDETIASAIFMAYNNYFHYHLAGSKKEYLKFAPNNLLLWEAIKYANDKGYKKFHFGGGITNSTEDNLFKFKSSFSKDYLDFYIGKRVHNEDVYKLLISNWEQKSNKKASILLQYR